MLAVTARTVRSIADRGELRRVRLSPRATRYERAEVEAFITARTAPLSEIGPAGNGADLSATAGTGRRGRA